MIVRSEKLFSTAIPGRRGEILDAALHVFGQEGYAGGSMRKIAEEVGISEPALYRHFTGKEELFLTLIEQSGRLMRERIASTLGQAHLGDPRETIHALLAGECAEAHDHVALVQTILAAAVHSATFLETCRAHLIAPLAEELTGVVSGYDASMGTSSTPEEMATRIQAAMCLLVGYAAMSDVLTDADACVEGAVMRIMGWPGP